MKDRLKSEWWDVAVRDHRKKITTAVILMFLFLILLSAAILALFATTEKKWNIQQAQYVMTSEISKLQYAIDSRLLSTEILEMIVVNNHGTVKEFDSIARQLYVDDPAIRSLQLAPDGVITYVYPLEGNEEAFGSLFDDPDRRVEAEFARDTGKMTLAGPFELYQGGLGLVARNPIYLEGPEGETVFWGFSVAILNVPEIFNKAELANLSQQGYDYQIWRIQPDNGERQIITGSTKGDMSSAIEDEISVPNGVWSFRMLPKTGWISSTYIVKGSIIALTIDLLLTLVLAGILTISQQKRKLAELVNTDFLTGLYNARYFMATMKKLYDQERPFGILYMDLNKFKAVNDRYGHDVGDKLLIEVGGRLKGSLSKDSFVFRIGGDEFSVVIAEDNSRAYYDALIEQLEKQIAEPYHFSDITLYPGISCGYSRYPEDQKDVEGLIREADRNMYAAKKKAVSG